MGLKFVLPIAGLTSLTAVPFAQLATPTTCAICLYKIELGQETSEASQTEQLSIARRSTASTLPTSTTPLALGRKDVASLLTGSTTTNATGIASATGTLTDTLLLPSFNVLNSFIWNGEYWLPPSGFLTTQFKTAPAANTWSGLLYFEEFP